MVMQDVTRLSVEQVNKKIADTAAIWFDTVEPAARRQFPDVGWTFQSYRDYGGIEALGIPWTEYHNAVCIVVLILLP